jgi:threonine/homoserine/homoserine lactone efflux protein
MCKAALRLMRQDGTVPLEQMLAFAAAVLPIMLTPGVSVTLVTQRVVGEGRDAGFRVTVGTACGLAAHAVAAVLGLAALVSESAAAFTALKLLGAVYLVVLGVNMLRSVTLNHAGSTAPSLPWKIDSAFAEAFVANLLNPRAASIYLSLVPQFISPGDDVLVVTAALLMVHIGMQTAWLSIWTVLVARARALPSERLRRGTEGLAGAVLIGLGVRGALQDRRI